MSEFKSIGMIRPIDKMGRVVIPKEMREYLGIEDDKDRFEIYLTGKSIILKKFQPTCVFCGEFADSVELNDLTVCKKCVDKLRELKEQNPEI